MIDNVLAPSSIVPVSPTGADTELELMDRLVRVAGQAGLTADPVTIVNVYVALKTKPLAILAGLPSTGKKAMLECLGRVLLEEPWRLQMMLGHAWWAEGSTNVATFTEAQTRCNTTKIYALLEEAARAENADQAYIGCLTQISLAELVGFFSDLAFQWQHERLMCLPSLHLQEPIPIPDNLLVVGTLDTEHFDWPDDDLYSQAIIIHWPAIGIKRPPDRYSLGAPVPGAEHAFFAGRVRSERDAMHKLQGIAGYRPQLMHAFWEVEDVFREQDLPVPDVIVEEVLLYVANAWTQQGHGLFDPATHCNMAIALDLAITQLMLTPAIGRIQATPRLHEALHDTLDGRFPRASGFLSALNNKTERKDIHAGKEVGKAWNAIRSAV